MGNAEFDKYFEVYSNNIEFVKTTINEEIMRFLADFYKKYKVKFDLLFKDDKIYIKFYTRDVFEVAVYGKVFNKKAILKYYTFMNFEKEMYIALSETIK